MPPGAIIADAGGLIFLVALILGGVGVYRLRQGKGARLLKTTLVLSLVLWPRIWSLSGPNILGSSQQGGQRATPMVWQARKAMLVV